MNDSRDRVESVPLRHGRGRNALALTTFASATVGAAMIGSRANRKNLGIWYAMQRKPPFQPSPKVFAPVWTALYGLMAASGYRVWKREPSPARSKALALWGVQLGLNAAWSVLFFGRRQKRAALADLIALTAVVVNYAVTARRVDPPAAAMMVPYIGWLGFAGLLNEEIVRRNEGF